MPKPVGGGVKGCSHTFFNDVISLENLFLSWEEFLRGKRKRKDVIEFSLRLTDNILTLREELVQKTYQHGRYLAFKINDPKPRDIHKALVRDRLIHHAIYRILYPYFDKKFIFDSYSCRVDKGTHRAINRFRNFAGKVSRNHTRTAWVLKGDIKKFFASIDHNILKSVLAKHMSEADILWLFGQLIDSFETARPHPALSSAEERGKVGLPLGNLTSQLLVNIYMNEFDQFVKRELKVKCYIRYADDFVIVHEDELYLRKLILPISKFLADKLKLILHPDKLFIKTYTSGVDFLGWVNFPNFRVPRTSTKRRMFRKLKRNKSKETVASYLGMLGYGDTHELRQRISLG